MQNIKRYTETQQRFPSLANAGWSSSATLCVTISVCVCGVCVWLWCMFVCVCVHACVCVCLQLAFLYVIPLMGSRILIIVECMNHEPQSSLYVVSPEILSFHLSLGKYAVAQTVVVFGVFNSNFQKSNPTYQAIWITFYVISTLYAFSWWLFIPTSPHFSAHLPVFRLSPSFTVLPMPWKVLSPSAAWKVPQPRRHLVR